MEMESVSGLQKLGLDWLPKMILSRNMMRLGVYKPHCWLQPCVLWDMSYAI